MPLNNNSAAIVWICNNRQIRVIQLTVSALLEDLYIESDNTAVRCCTAITSIVEEQQSSNMRLAQEPQTQQHALQQET